MNTVRALLEPTTMAHAHSGVPALAVLAEIWRKVAPDWSEAAVRGMLGWKR